MTSTLLTTPLTVWHRAHGGRMVPFAGWEMPVEYSGVRDEHLAVRTRAGLFDVSHMGQVEVAGNDALAAVQAITSNDASRLAVGQAQYSALTSPSGTFVDDLLVYRLAKSHFLFVVNAANTGKDVAWIAAQVKPLGDVVALNTSARYALLALQGPAAAEVLAPLTGAYVDGLEPYWFTHGEVAGVRATIARTGYTGEDGYEIFVPPQSASRVWGALLSEGRDAGLVPAGLAARDTLRLEAAMRLYGQDIDETTTVLEAGLGRIVAWDKGEFNGRAALSAQRAAGVQRRLVGFEMTDRAIARHGHGVFVEGEQVGVVTSGTQTPFVKKAIGMAYLPVAHTQPGTAFDIDVRGRRSKASVVPLPFYKRSKG
jgi:aminomethyltransferase